MSYRATVVKVFLASPSDTTEDRADVRQAIEEWNAEHSEVRQVVFQAVGWDSHTTPEFGAEPQAIINRQALDGCDALIALFWSTVGSPTRDAPSGTVEEIYRFADAGKHVALFFSDKPLPRDVDTERLEALRRFQRDQRSNCLYETFSPGSQLQRLIQRTLTRLAEQHAVPLGSRLSSPPQPRSSTRITARLTGSDRQRRLEVRNAGTTTVWNVEVTIPDEVGWMDVHGDLPIDVLRPGDVVRLMVSTHMGGGPQHFDLSIDATDDDGEALPTQYAKISL